MWRNKQTAWNTSHNAYKVELRLTSAQIKIIERTMGVCRYVYNLFIATNQDNFRDKTRGYMSCYEFSKWLNHEYKTANPDKQWIWEVSSKSVKKAGRYFASFVYETEQNITITHTLPEGVGIDLGIKSFAVVSDGRHFPNINYTPRMRLLKKRLKREQKKFSRKIHKLLHRKEEATKKCNRSNLDKQRLMVQRVYMKLSNKRHDYIKKAVHEIVSTHPSYITIEDLNISGMMKNRCLAKAIAECEFWYFRELLERKCKKYRIQLRIAGMFYASSKTCSRCGHVKRDLTLSERIYKCLDCGFVMDRDMNAAMNLRDCVKYATAG